MWSCEHFHLYLYGHEFTIISDHKPKVLKSDNGPPFNGNEFRQIADYLGFKHRKITPLWPKANAESERFMRTIEKTVPGYWIVLCLC